MGTEEERREKERIGEKRRGEGRGGEERREGGGRVARLPKRGWRQERGCRGGV